jgi:hypothetical protein
VFDLDLNGFVKNYESMTLLKKMMNYENKGLSKFLSSYESKVEKELTSNLLDSYFGFKANQPVHGEWYNCLTIKDLYSSYDNGDIDTLKSELKKRISTRIPEILSIDNKGLSKFLTSSIKRERESVKSDDIIRENGILNYTKVYEIKKNSDMGVKLKKPNKLY